MNYRIKWLSSVCYAPLAVALVMSSCAEGVDDNERFNAGVSNTQLESPELDPNTFKIQINADGSESVEVSWPVVFGAGGYLANVQDITNPANPVAIVKDSVIDGCKFSFPRLVDTKYEVSVSTLGNDKLNNTASATPTIAMYSTFLPATIIPEGMEISQFIAANLEASTEETAFELEAGKNYKLTGEVNFGLTPITLRGDKYNRPFVEVSEEGVIVTQAGLKIKNINFDCSSSKPESSFIKLSPTPDASISTEALGFKALGANQNGYVIMGQIAIESCNFRNLPGSIIWGNKQPYSRNDFRITDCIVQMKNATSKTFIDFSSASGNTGLVKSMTLKNSTFYNLEENKSAYFFRYSNPSNADPQKTFGTGATSIHTYDHCTLDRTFTGKDFANNMPTVERFEVVWKDNIFYDVFRIYQYIRSNNVKRTTEGNVIYGPLSGINSNDLKYATEANPEFAGPTLLEFNLDEAKGGVNYRPQAAICVENKTGDPRWYE